MATIQLNTERSNGTINKNIYGHFSEHLGRCIYQGIFVGKDSTIPNVNGIRSDVVEALKKIKVPVLRWPGGCFADEYHWEDGIGSQEQRKRMVNNNWGGLVEDNSFGTHEFLDLCEQIGCEPYINANVGSGTVREMADWIEYLNSDSDSTIAQRRWANGRKEAWDVRYWGIGNENWGGGGNMRAEYYADVYRRYATYCRNFCGKDLYKIACGPGGDDYHWTEVMMQQIRQLVNAITLHYYTLPNGDWENKGSATDFSLEEFYSTLVRAQGIGAVIKGHCDIMDRYDPEKKVGLIVDEWGTWCDVEPGTNPCLLYQQNTMRDALVAAITLNIFNRHCDRIPMANLAQAVNVLQSVILTKGKEMVLTPTYHVFDLYQAHQGAKEIHCFVQSKQVGVDRWKIGQVAASASEKDGVITVTMANLSADQGTEVMLRGTLARQVEGQILVGYMNQYNDFGKSTLSVEEFHDYQVRADEVAVALPACSVLSIKIQ